LTEVKLVVLKMMTWQEIQDSTMASLMHHIRLNQTVTEIICCCSFIQSPCNFTIIGQLKL